MNTNSFVLYSDVTTVYDELISFCNVHGFKVKATNEKYFSIIAKKTSILFWRSLQMELKILAVEKKKVEVNVMIYKYGKRKSGLENEYAGTLNKLFSNK